MHRIIYDPFQSQTIIFSNNVLGRKWERSFRLEKSQRYPILMCHRLEGFFFYLYAVCRQFEASASRAWRLRFGAGSARRRAVSREARGRRRAFAVLTLGPTSMATCLLHCRPRDGEAPCTVAQRLLYRDVPAAASHGTACWACQGSGCFGRRAAEDPLSSCNGASGPPTEPAATDQPAR